MGEIRGLLIRVFTGVGLLVATATAVDRTIFRESFAPIIIDLKVDRRLDAYLPFYKRMKPLVSSHAEISPIELRMLADDWIAATQSNQLEPLLTSFHGENMEDSPKGQLLRTTMRFAESLTKVARVELDNGMTDDGVADAIRATAVIDSVRFASPHSLILATTAARLPLKLASENVAKVKALPELLSRQLRLSQSVDKKYSEMEQRAAQLKLVYEVRYGKADADEVEDNVVIPGSKNAAQRFYGFTEERHLVAGAKACKFVTR